MKMRTPFKGRGALGALGQQVKRSVSLPSLPAFGRKGPARSAPVATSRRPAVSRVALDGYSAGLVIVLVLGLLVRLPGILAAAVDSPGEPQAALAAFVEALSRNGGNLAQSLPWQGPLPADLTAGLPLFAWLAALPTALLGPEAVFGRAISLIATLLATTVIFAVVRRLAGGRAALYATLFMFTAPLALYYGRAYLPEALGWAAASGALLATLRLQDSTTGGRDRSRLWLVLAAGGSALALLVNPMNLALLPLLLYIARPWRVATPISSQQYDYSPALAHEAERRRISGARLFVAAAVAPLVLWWLFTRIADLDAPVAAAYGGGGIGDTVRLWTSFDFYGLLLGKFVNTSFTVIGFLILLAGLGRRARQPWPWAIHLWALGGIIMVFLSAGRLGADDSVLAVLAPPMAALAGAGAAWIAGLPAQIMAAMNGQPEADSDDDSGAVPSDDGGAVRGAVRKRGADPLTLVPGSKLSFSLGATRDNLIILGNLLVVLLFAGMLYLGLGPLRARYEADPTVEAGRLAGIRAATTEPARHGAGKMVVAGSSPTGVFYGSGLDGWALTQAEFNRATLDKLRDEGATMLFSADQQWLNKHGDYRGLLASYKVAMLDKNFIIFDLTQAPDASDSLYFLESGHTLRGSFRVFWETRGGIAAFGFPITEEIQEVNPVDGMTRTVQYFERAVLELHPENAGTAYDVMPAPVGLWILQRKVRDMADQGTELTGINRVPEFPSTDTNHYFAETGHGLRGEFLRYWNERGGVAVFGYPISEERREVNPVDGKVHIVQYFERARFEWHEEASGTPDQVQLGLVGKEWFDLR